MRHTFGADLASYTIDLSILQETTQTGQIGVGVVIVGGQQVTFWDAQTGGTQYTDLLTATTGGPTDPGGEAISSVYTSSGADTDPPLGSIPMFLGPEEITYMWAQVEASGGGEALAATPQTDVDAPGTDPGTDPGTGADADQFDADGNPINPVILEDPAADDSDLSAAVQNTSTAGDRLLILASTAGYALTDTVQGIIDDLGPRVTDLEKWSKTTDQHQTSQDQAITALQSQTGSGGAGGGITTGTTSERGPASLGAMFLDITLNRLWMGIKGADGNPQWAPPAGTVVFKARTTKIITMDDSGVYPMPWDTIDLDLLAGWRGAAAPTRYVPTVPGYYLLNGAVSFSGHTQANPRSVRYIQWRTTNATIPANATAVYFASTSYTSVLPARGLSMYLNGTTDYVELCGYHNADVELTTAITGYGQPGVNITYQGGYGTA